MFSWRNKKNIYLGTSYLELTLFLFTKKKKKKKEKKKHILVVHFCAKTHKKSLFGVKAAIFETFGRHILHQNINCRYWLEFFQWGSSNEYYSMFCCSKSWGCIVQFVQKCSLSGYRCRDCVQILARLLTCNFHGDWSWNNFWGNFPSSVDSRRAKVCAQSAG